ncbi:DUF4157 domain-containing protein [Streptomyces sp. NPDC056013]|uniref:eCIS core domain-containing protein n=1 Tax=unclassified Streptomyces TaxID=2593676 RepID=UPI0035DD56C5
MRADDRTRHADPGRTSTPARTSTSRGTASVPDALRALQSGAGNAAVVQMLRQAGHPYAQEQHTHGAGCGHQETAPQVQRSTVHDVLRGGGRPMDAPLRTEMESRLGADFSDVRIHDSGAARASAAEIGARAYTSGNNVVIGDGGGDKHTLAHELTHVIQQRQGPVSGTDNGGGLSISDPSDRYERAAEANATRVMSGAAPVQRAEDQAMAPDQSVHVAHGSARSAVQRAPDELKVSSLHAANPHRGSVGTVNDDGHIEVTSDQLYNQVLAPETSSAQGEHVFNALNALAMGIHADITRDFEATPELVTALDALQDAAETLRVKRDHSTFRAAPAGKGNSANSNSYSAYAEDIRAAVRMALSSERKATDAEKTAGRRDEPPRNFTGGWSRLVELSQNVLDRTIDLQALAYQDKTYKTKEYREWKADTIEAMQGASNKLLNAVWAAHHHSRHNDTPTP